MPVHLTPAYAALGQSTGSFPVAEAAAEQILSLPIFPHLTESQQERVVDALATRTASLRKRDAAMTDTDDGHASR